MSRNLLIFLTAGCGVPDTTPAPEIMYLHAQGVQRGLTAKKKFFFESLSWSKGLAVTPAPKSSSPQHRL